MRSTKYTIQSHEGCYTVLDHNGNFFAKTYSGYDARLIASSPVLFDLLKEVIESCHIHDKLMSHIVYEISEISGENLSHSQKI